MTVPVQPTGTDAIGPNPGVIGFDEPAALDAGLVGGKAANLAYLRKRGEAVPDGLVVLPGGDAAVAAKLARARFDGVPMAVRSSSIAEDLASASFAGQYRSVLDVKTTEGITTAIEEVRSSAADPVARGYAESAPVPMPVLLMPMVPAEVAGVAFGANPVTGEDEIVIEAVVGLGESLVSGSVTPQRYVVRQEVTADVDASPVLDEAQTMEIAGIVRRLGDVFSGPQDIEWAIANGKFHLLQARPITALPISPEVDLPGPRETWMRADENYSAPARPLEFSVWAPRLEASFTKVFAEVGAPIETMRYRSIGGWVYARFVPPMDQGKDDGPVPPAWLFGTMARLIPPIRSRLTRAAQVWESDLAARVADDWDSGGRTDFRARTRALRTVDRASLDDAGLADHVEAVLSHLQEASDIHFRLPVLATFLPVGRLGVLLERHAGWNASQTLRLLQGYSSVTDAADALDEVVVAVLADADARRLLSDDPKRLPNHPGPSGDVLRRYLQDNGHRTVGMDLAHRTWAEDPMPVVAMLRARLAHSRTDRGTGLAESETAEAEMRAALATDPTSLSEIDEVLAAARRGISYGDDTETDVFEGLALVRYAALEAGRRLAARSVTGDPDDVWYLTESEMLSALRGAAIDADVDRRRAEHLWALAHPGPPRYGPEPPPMPSMRWMPRRARPFLESMMWAMETMTASPTDAPSEDGTLSGVAASPGRATGVVRVVRSPAEFDRIQPGDVLVCPCTVAAWSVVFPVVAGIVTEVGGPLSHPGILAREFGIPAVLGIPDVTTLLVEGQMVTVDGTAGRVEIAS